MSRATQRRRAYERFLESCRNATPSIPHRSDELNAKVYFPSLKKYLLKDLQIGPKKHSKKNLSKIKKLDDKAQPKFIHIKAKPTRKDKKNRNPEVLKAIKKLYPSEPRLGILINYENVEQPLLIEITKGKLKIRLPFTTPTFAAAIIKTNRQTLKETVIYQNHGCHVLEIHRQIFLNPKLAGKQSYAIIFANGKYVFDNERKISYFKAN